METAAQAVAGTPWIDDAGARTADLYDWQAAMAAADALRLILDSIDRDGVVRHDRVVELICEHHEDWTVVVDTDAELVSAKHREPASGAWTTLGQLSSAGGLRHLFDRWISLRQLPSLRLVTCAGLKSGECSNVNKVADLLRDKEHGVELSTESDALIDKTLQALTKELLCADGAALPDNLAGPAKADWVDLPKHDPRVMAVRLFLTRLRFDVERPGRKHVYHAAPSMFAAPLLQHIGREDVPALAVWEAVLALFRVRMRAQGPVPGGMLPLVLAAAEGNYAGTTAASRDRELAKRRITLPDIYVAVKQAVENAQAYVPVRNPLHLSTLSVKMDIGGCADTSIARAENLRSDFRQFMRSRDDSAPGEWADRRVLDRWLLRIADEETSRVRDRAGQWGADLWAALSARLAAGDVHELPSLERSDFDGELALGGVCDLAYQCKVWFSPAFDVRGELARRRFQRRTAT